MTKLPAYTSIARKHNLSASDGVPDPLESPNEMAGSFLKVLSEHYWAPLHEELDDNPELSGKVPYFLRVHSSISIYFGRTHVAVEYTGPEFGTEYPTKYTIDAQIFDYSIEECNMLEKIVGFRISPTHNIPLRMPPYIEDFISATEAGWSALEDLGWNFAAQNAMYGFNTGIFVLPRYRHCRMVNARFFDANDGGLFTRHIKWIDFFPILFDGSDNEIDVITIPHKFWPELARSDAYYELKLPSDFKFRKLPILNRFVEMWGSDATSEPEITRFLSDPQNRFILTMRFGATEIEPEALCAWQSEDRDPIKPDFFLVHTNGYADILEFKKPTSEGPTVVGRTNRESFSAWLNSYISQTRVYSTYFDDPNNRRWFEQKYGFRVYKPRRYLVVGRRTDFAADTWREIAADYRDLELLNFDDLMDGVKVQFYR